MTLSPFRILVSVALVLIALLVQSPTSSAADGMQQKNTPEALEARLQALDANQLDTLFQQTPKLKAIADQAGPMGMAFLKSQYKTYPWRNTFANWSQASRDELDAALTQVAGPSVTVQSVAAKIRDLSVAQAQTFICADVKMKAFIASLPTSFQDGVKTDHRAFGWEAPLKDRQSDLPALSTLADRAKANGLPACAVEKPKTVPLPSWADKLIRPATGDKAYLVDKAGFKRWIASSQVFDGCGFEWGRVETPSAAVVDGISEGQPLNTVEACRGVRSTQPNAAMARKLIQYGPEATVYFVSPEGIKRPIANPGVFSACGFDWGKIEKSAASVVFGMPTGQAIAAVSDCPQQQPKSDPSIAGKLLKADGNAAVYLVDKNGYKRLIRSAAIFESCGLDWGRVETVAAARIAGVADAEDLMTADACRAQRATQANPGLTGKLLKLPPEPAVYYVDKDGKRRWVSSEAVMKDCGFDASKLEYPGAAVIFAMPAGPTLASKADCAVAAQPAAPTGGLISVIPRQGGTGVIAITGPAFTGPPIAIPGLAPPPPSTPQAPAGGRLLTVTNVCSDSKGQGRHESIAIKNNENGGSWQLLDGKNTDVVMEANSTRTFAVSGQRHWVKFSGTPDFWGKEVTNPDNIAIVPNPDNGMCALMAGNLDKITMGVAMMKDPKSIDNLISGQAKDSGWRLTQANVSSKDPKVIAANVSRIIEMYSSPVAQITDEERAFISRLSAYVSGERVNAADQALVALKAYREQHRQQAIQQGFNTSLALLGDTNMGQGNTPDTFKQMARSGISFPSDSAASDFAKLQGDVAKNYGAQSGGLIIAAAGATGALAGVAAQTVLFPTTVTAVTQSIAPFASTVGQSAATAVAEAGTQGAVRAAGVVTGRVVGVAGGAAAGVAAAIGAIISFGVGLDAVLTEENYENELIKIRENFRNSPFSVPAAVSSDDGRKLIHVYMVKLQGGF